MPAGVNSVHVYVPDSLKSFWLETGPGTFMSSPADVSANVLVPSAAAKSSSAAAWKYSVASSRTNPLLRSQSETSLGVPIPEAIPGISIPKENWLDLAHPIFDGDGYQQDIPLGFSFTFYGNTYDKVNIYANGFLQFGAPQADPFKLGFYKGAGIPASDLPNNIIAFAWTDWSPQLVDGGVRFETRGEAPNRRFILQFNNVPDYSSCKCSTGLLMMQLVLYEGSNVITIYTNTLKITSGGQRITQGIENADGTEAVFDSVTNSITGVTSARVRNFFSLADDFVQFAPPRPPTVTPPANISVATTPPVAGLAAAMGSCVASPDPGVATATDDIGVVSLVGVRSDDPTLALNAPYPKGVTTITWTATDTDGMQTSALQTVTVVDKENPLLTAPGAITSETDLHLPSAVVAAGSASASDNCHDVTVSSARSDGAALSAPFMVGVTKITWTAADLSGNSTSAEQSVTVLDREAPRLVVPESFIVPATSVSGGVVNYNVTALDNVAVVSLVCTRESGLSFPMGDITVECTASDAAGNSTKGTFVVSVLNAQLQMQSLIQYIYGLHMPNGTTNPLVNQVSAALGGDNHVACVKMNQFVDLVSKKTRDIPWGSGPYMIGEATRICDVLGCPTSKGHQQQSKP